MYRITNIYVLAAFGTIGGALFGFDIRYGTRLALLSADADPPSSMSAWIGTQQYLEYFNHPDSSLQGGVCLFPTDSARMG